MQWNSAFFLPDVEILSQDAFELVAISLYVNCLLKYVHDSTIKIDKIISAKTNLPLGKSTQIIHSFCSAIKCPNCIYGCVLPLNSLDYESIWSCQHNGDGGKG